MPSHLVPKDKAKTSHDEISFKEAWPISTVVGAGSGLSRGQAGCRLISSLLKQFRAMPYRNTRMPWPCSAQCPKRDIASINPDPSFECRWARDLESCTSFFFCKASQSLLWIWDNIDIIHLIFLVSSCLILCALPSWNPCVMAWPDLGALTWIGKCRLRFATAIGVLRNLTNFPEIVNAAPMKHMFSLFSDMTVLFLSSSLSSLLVSSKPKRPRVNKARLQGSRCASTFFIPGRQLSYSRWFYGPVFVCMFSFPRKGSRRLGAREQGPC